MTVKNLIELVRKNFPNVGEKETLVILNNKQKDFARETRILVTRAELSDIGTNFAWSLPGNFIEYKDIKCYDSDGNYYEYKDLGIKFEIEFGKLFAKSLNEIPITSISNSINKIYLHYYYSPSAITSISDTFEIDEIGRAHV